MNSIPLVPYLPQFLLGTLITLALMICSLLLGAMAAMILTVINLSRFWYLKLPVNIFTFIIRGTPLLVQIFLIYYGSSQFDALRASPLWIVLQKPFACAVIALAINTCAYTTVLFGGAVKSVPRGEIEACKALGMSWLQMLRRIVLPRAFRIVLPAYSNEIILVLKGTSLASTITILDLMGVTQKIIAETYASIEFLLFAGVIYFALNLLIISGFRSMEQRWNVYLLKRY